jgi:hypothetical protein
MIGWRKDADCIPGRESCQRLFEGVRNIERRMTFRQDRRTAERFFSVKWAKVGGSGRAKPWPRCHDFFGRLVERFDVEPVVASGEVDDERHGEVHRVFHLVAHDLGQLADVLFGHVEHQFVVNLQ